MVGCRKESYFLEFMYVDVARDFVGVVLMVLRAPITTRIFVVLSPHICSTLISKFLYLLSFSMVLTEVLVSRGMVVSMRRQVLPFLFCSTMSGLLAAIVLVSVDGHVPQNGDAVLPGDSHGFILIPSFLHLSAKLFADLPVHV